MFENWLLSTTQVQVGCTQTWRSVQIFCDLLTDHPRSALRSSRHVSEEHDKRVPSVHWWWCYATLTRAEMVGYIQIPVVFGSIELLFPQPCWWYCKCDHRSDPPKSGATPRPQPAPSRNPSERQRLLSHQAAAYYSDHLHSAVVTGTVHVDAGFGRLNPHGIESTVSIAHDLLHGKVSCQYRGWAPRSSSIVRQCAGNSQSASDFPSSIQTCGVALLQLCYS